MAPAWLSLTAATSSSGGPQTLVTYITGLGTGTRAEELRPGQFTELAALLR